MLFKKRKEKFEDRNPFAPSDKETWMEQREKHEKVTKRYDQNIIGCSGVFITDYWIPKNDKVKRRE